MKKNAESVQVSMGYHILAIDVFVARLYMLHYLVAYHVNDVCMHTMIALLIMVQTPGRFLYLESSTWQNRILWRRAAHVAAGDKLAVTVPITELLTTFGGQFSNNHELNK